DGIRDFHVTGVQTCALPISKGLAAAAKKSSRTAAEGLVGVAVEGTAGVAVEVNSETDFVAKNDQFQDFVRKTTEVALGVGGDDRSEERRVGKDGGGWWWMDA